MHPDGRIELGTWISQINVAAIPEPSTYAMMILGLGGLGGFVARRRHNVGAFDGWRGPAVEVDSLEPGRAEAILRPPRCRFAASLDTSGREIRIRLARGVDAGQRLASMSWSGWQPTTARDWLRQWVQGHNQGRFRVPLPHVAGRLRSTGEQLGLLVDDFLSLVDRVKQRRRATPAMTAGQAVVAPGLATALRRCLIAPDDDDGGDVVVALPRLEGPGVDLVPTFGAFVEMHWLLQNRPATGLGAHDARRPGDAPIHRKGAPDGDARAPTTIGRTGRPRAAPGRRARR